jgi:hypothetical protein
MSLAECEDIIRKVLPPEQKTGHAPTKTRSPAPGAAGKSATKTAARSKPTPATNKAAAAKRSRAAKA